MLKFKFILARHKIKLITVTTIIVGYLLIPVPKFNEPTSTVIYSKQGRLLGAKLATDDQWRFPVIDTLPQKYKQAVLLFEDKYFYYHPGFNPISIVRALKQNISAGEVVSGGSTISMQVIRLARKGKERSLKEKIIELVLATKLELKYSKNEILSLYASYAPFGGNVVGIEAASWRYFGRSPDNLSWAESATLAVLPNAPSLIYPGKNQLNLKHKRDRLLKLLNDHNIIDSLTFALSVKERLPRKPKELPQQAPHLLTKMVRMHPGEKVITSVDYFLQQRINDLIARHIKHLSANEIHNAAVLVVDNATEQIIAYVGNSKQGPEHAEDVDLIDAPRSSGSILKPILFASIINDGELLPMSLVPDIPMFMEGFSPKNYSLTFDGAVPASKALSRSLNVPAVHMLSKYGVARFHNQLQRLKFSTITQAPEYYGLSLILGGAETTLWDLVRVYSGMARILQNSVKNNYIYSASDIVEPTFFENIYLNTEKRESKEPVYFSAASIWCTFKAMLEVNRPDAENGWQSFASADKIAWKTGTSFGFRDAWALGVTPQYTVGVWVGNADGEGRPGLTGVTAAAPIMFDVFKQLKLNGWFSEPYDEFVQAEVCHESGYLASINCNHIDTVEIPETGLRSRVCPYHKIIHLDKTGTFQVNSSCENPEDIIQKSWFVLPPAMEYYYRQKNPYYLPLPPMKKGCSESGNQNIMEFVYPGESAKIYVPVDIYGKKGKVVFEVAHRNSDAQLFWHIDNQYIQATKEFHQIAINPPLGKHLVTVVDEDGNSISKWFEIVSK